MGKMVTSVTKSNAMIEAGYRLSLTEMQIILYGISLINPLQKDFPLTYKIEIKRFSELFNRTHGDIYKEIKQAITKKLWHRDFSYLDEKNNIVAVRWLTSMKHQDKTGYLEIRFHDEIQPYLHQLKSHFTTYYIDKIAYFKSVYSIRVYEFSIMEINKIRQKKYTFLMSISEFKKRLELDNKYNRFYNLKERVLEKARKEINKHSDLNISYKITKLGRTPYEIEFTVTRKNDKKQANSKPPKDKLTPSMIEKGKKIALASGLDIYDIEQQFYSYIRQKGAPINLEGAFIGFVKKKADTPI